MATEFSLIFEEFSTELDALLEMIDVPQHPSSNRLSPRARVAAGNAAMLLLAAVFEEYVRQQVRAAFKEMASRHSAGTAKLPLKLASQVWRRSLEMLARTDFSDVLADTTVEARLDAVFAFAIKMDFQADVGEAVSHNQNNMRPTQLSELFNGIGVVKVIEKVCTDRKLLDHLNCGAGKAVEVLQSNMNAFFKRRNLTAHAVAFGSSSGPTEIEQDIVLMKVFGNALSNALTAEFG